MHTLSLRAVGLGVVLWASAVLAQIDVQPIGRLVRGPLGTGAAEIAAYDPATRQLYVVNAFRRTVDILHIDLPTGPSLVRELSLTPWGRQANSVAVRDGVVAVAVESTTRTDPGKVVFFDAQGQYINHVMVGAVPDMLTFTPNGRWVLVANEGEPNDTYTIDPEGSVSVIDLSRGPAGVTQADVRTAGFTRFNGATLDPSIRIFGPRATVAQDLEPEYITVSHDSRTAWVTLQENNALGLLDIESATFTRLKGLGFKNHRLPGNGLDASDRDGAIRIRTWPVKGMYQPDAIASYRVGGQTYLVMANEGDARDYPGYSEEVRIGSLRLDPEAFPDAATLTLPANLGRLKATTASGDTNGDGRYEDLYTFGARSFSIRTSSGELVWDSGEQLEQLTAAAFPSHFNADQDAHTFDQRSDDKGPEPEGVAVGNAFGRTYAFIGLERIGGVMVFDISVPTAPAVVAYVNPRSWSGSPKEGSAGDLGPEGLLFIRAEDSPSGSPLLVVTNEVSGSTTVFEISRR